MEYPAAFPNGLVNPSNYNLASSSVNNVNIDSDISKIQLPNEIENSSGSDTTNINKDNTNRIQESQRYQPNNQNKLVNSSISALSIETKQPNAIGMADSHNSIHSNSNNAFPMNNLNSNMSNNNNSNQMNPMSMNPNLPMNLGSIASYANLTSHHAMNFAGFGNTYSPYMRSIGSDPGMAYQSVSLQRPDQNNTNNTQGAKRKYDQLQQETGQGESYGSSDEDDDDDDEDGSKGKKSGRRKIKIEYIGTFFTFLFFHFFSTFFVLFNLSH